MVCKRKAGRYFFKRARDDLFAYSLMVIHMIYKSLICKCVDTLPMVAQEDVKIPQRTIISGKGKIWTKLL